VRRLLASVVFVASVLSAGAQEDGRASLTTGSPSAGLGRGSLPPANTEHGYFAGSWGLKLDLGWANLKWDVGATGGSEGLFAPQASIFYKTTENLDVNVSLMHLSGKDDDSVLGANKGEFTRLALGLRYWMPTGTRVAPFFGGGIGYYLLDGNTDRTREDGEVRDAGNVSVKDQPGAFLEAGLSFLVSDGFMVNTGLSYDFLLGSADATINGRDDDFDIKAFSINLGVAWKF